LHPIRLRCRSGRDCCRDGIRAVHGSVPAERVIVDEARHGWLVAAERACGVLVERQLAELHRQRVDEQQAADQRLAGTEDDLDRLGGLERADDAGQHAEHAALFARRHELRRPRAEASFERPTAPWPWSTWRWRFERLTRSLSTRPSVPMPAAARYSAAGEPRPPTPMSRTRADFRRSWPSGPTSGSVRWRA